MNQYQEFIHKSRYAKWIPEEGRRENWDETVGRYIKFFMTHKGQELQGAGVPYEEIDALEQAIINMDIMPSMRSLMTAGAALARDNVAGFNCSYVAVDHPRVFDEIMYILMCGTGVGFSVERQYVNQLPEVAEEFHETDTTIRVRDSRMGWASSYKDLISLLYNGRLPRWDTSKLRPAGAKLKTFGGRSSGPEPLESLFKFTVKLFQRSAGRKLTSLECHDLVCKVADIVVVGGVRRSALISLSNLSDDRVRAAKSGAWWEHEPQRALANNSAVYTEKPDFSTFLKEWTSLYESKSGERGIFSRVASERQAAKNGRREPYVGFGTNPCSEIILRSCQFCNLSEVVVRASDTLQDLERKVRAASILGTFQSTLTDFRYLRPIWKKNTEEEALLGVSLTGIMDHPVLNGSSPLSDEFVVDTNHFEFLSLSQVLTHLKEIAIETNKEWAGKLGVNASAAITCVKPSGTVSQLVDSASGIHSRFAPYYIRRVRADIKDPLTQLLISEGVPNEPDVMKPDATVVFSFPQKAPEGAKLVKDDTAVAQLDIWKVYQDHWCEHKPSVTVYYGDDEFLAAGSWVFNNFDSVSGVSFLPRSEHTYQQAPYEEISEECYKELRRGMPEIVWERLGEFEKEDQTKGTQELACSGGSCEIVDI